MENSVSRPKFGFSHMRVTVFLVFARNIFQMLTGNVYFPSVAVLLPGLSAANAAYSEAIDAALNRDRLKVADRNSKRLIVEAILREIAGVLMSLSSEREILMTSGFEITDGRGPVSPVGQVEGLKFSFTPGVSGKVTLRWKRSSAREAASFVIEQTTGDPTSPETQWEVADYSKKCTCDITDLIPGESYSWRVYGLGALGPGGKSVPVSTVAV